MTPSRKHFRGMANEVKKVLTQYPPHSKGREAVRDVVENVICPMMFHLNWRFNKETFCEACGLD
jgi:hypothetical protein